MNRLTMGRQLTENLHGREEAGERVLRLRNGARKRRGQGRGGCAVVKRGVKGEKEAKESQPVRAFAWGRRKGQRKRSLLGEWCRGWAATTAGWTARN